MAKGGGAWKVAYADFITALMAFFLVMWITAQDEKIKENIAHYFIDPMGYQPIGKTGGEPADKGALIPAKINGPVPTAQSLAAGQGRRSLTDAQRAAYVTSIVTNWLRTDPKALEYWVALAHAIRKEVARTTTGPKKSDEIDTEAARRLAIQLKDEIESQLPVVQGVYKDLLDDSLLPVMWKEIAEDLLTH